MKKRKSIIINFLIGIFLICLFVPINQYIESLSKNNIYNPSAVLLFVGIPFVYVSIRNSIYSIFNKDINKPFTSNPLLTFLIVGIVIIFTFGVLIMLAPDLIQSWLQNN